MIASGNPWKIVFFTSHFKTLNASSWNNLFELRKDESSRNFDHLNEWSPERDCRSLPFWQAEREPFSSTLIDERLWNQWGLAPRAYLHDCDSRERPCAPPRLTVLELRTRSAMMIEFQCVHAIQDRMCKAPKIGRGTAVHGIPPFARTRLSVNTPSRPLSPLPHE